MLAAISVPAIPSPPTVKTVTYTSSSPKVITKAVTKSKVLFEGRNLYIPFMGYRYSGPYYLKAGQTITESWDADTIVNVYIMNDVDWGKRFFGAPTSWRSSRSGERGSVSYTLRYDEPIYVQVMTPTWVSAKLYVWKEELTWRETVTETTYVVVTVTKTVKEEHPGEYISLLELLLRYLAVLPGR